MLFNQHVLERNYTSVVEVVVYPGKGTYRQRVDENVCHILMLDSVPTEVATNQCAIVCKFANHIRLDTDLDDNDVDYKDSALVLQQSKAAEWWHDVHGSPNACTLSAQVLLVL